MKSSTLSKLAGTTAILFAYLILGCLGFVTVGLRNSYKQRLLELMGDSIDPAGLPALTSYVSCPISGISEASIFGPWFGITIWAIFAVWPAFAIFPTIRANNIAELGPSIIAIFVPWLLAVAVLVVLVPRGFWLAFAAGNESWLFWLRGYLSGRGHR